jgi:hypothetical protein
LSIPGCPLNLALGRVQSAQRSDPIRIEQYSRDLGNEGYAYQFWTFDRDHHHAVLLNKGEERGLAAYPAGFRFTPDSQ